MVLYRKFRHVLEQRVIQTRLRTMSRQFPNIVSLLIRNGTKNPVLSSCEFLCLCHVSLQQQTHEKL